MGQRERKRRQSAAERDATVREALRPLEPGERPLPVTVAAVVAGLLAVGNLVCLIAGVKVKGSTTGGVLILVAILGVAAVGMWRVKYWAVLGFEALLAFTILYAFAGLILASSLRGVAVAVPTMVLAGWLFWKLIRAMARIQMPERPVS
jgi:hypothetical protein